MKSQRPNPRSLLKRPMRKQTRESMPLVDHLGELRTRLIVSAVAVLLAAIVAFIFTDNLIGILKAPAGNIVLHVFSPMDGFMVKWRVAVFAGLAIASPIWAYELISFLAPGLTVQERRVIIPLTVVAFLLLMLGVGFGYYLLYGMIQVLIGLFGTQLDYFPSADAYISFVTFFLLSTGLAFELPVVLYALVRLHLISTELLRKQRKYFYFGMFVFAEIITPVSDPIVAPLTITLPMIVLYEITLFIARLGEKSARRALVESESSS